MTLVITCIALHTDSAWCILFIIFNTSISSCTYLSISATDSLLHTSLNIWIWLWNIKIIQIVKLCNVRTTVSNFKLHSYLQDEINRSIVNCTWQLGTTLLFFFGGKVFCFVGTVGEFIIVFFSTKPSTPLPLNIKWRVPKLSNSATKHLITTQFDPVVVFVACEQTFKCMPFYVIKVPWNDWQSSMWTKNRTWLIISWSYSSYNILSSFSSAVHDRIIWKWLIHISVKPCYRTWSALQQLPDSLSTDAKRC